MSFPRRRESRVLNFDFIICNLFVIYDFEFVIYKILNLSFINFLLYELYELTFQNQSSHNYPKTYPLCL